VSHPAIEKLIPHRGAMLFIDAVIAGSEDDIACRARIRRDNLFLRAPGGWLRSVVCLEYMAQTVAAYAGLHAHRLGQLGAERVGFLVAASRVLLGVPRLELGDELDISASRLWGDADLGKFECAVARGGVRIAEATLSVYRPPLAAEGAG
jgi:predicted hotdog family 3-hydroxylacyl-ACP dehydratase